MSTMSVRMKAANTVITEPMLMGFAEKKNAAFQEAYDHLTEGRLRLNGIDGEVALFKKKVLKTIKEYQQEVKPLTSRVEVVGGRGRLREEYAEFISLYVKASILAYKTMETINYLKPAYRAFSEEEIFRKNEPDIYRQLKELDRNCSTQADELQKLVTQIVHQKNAFYALIYDPSLICALEQLDAVVDVRDPPSSRVSQIFSYITSYVSPPENEEALATPSKLQQRSHLLLSTDPGPAPKTAPLRQRASLSIPVEKMPQRNTTTSPLLRRRSSTMQTSSPRSSSGHSPRFLDIPPIARQRRSSVDSWESIPLSSRSGSLPHRSNFTEETSSYPSTSYSWQTCTESWENIGTINKATNSLRRSNAQDAGSSSKEEKKLRSSHSELFGEKTPSDFRTERRLVSSRDSTSPSYSRRDLDRVLSKEPRSKLSYSGSETVKLTSSREISRYPQEEQSREMPSLHSSRREPYYRDEKRITPNPQEKFLQSSAMDKQGRQTRSSFRDTSSPAVEDKPKHDRTRRLSLKGFIHPKKEG